MSPEKHMWGKQENAASLGHPMKDVCPSLALGHCYVVHLESSQDLRAGDQNTENDAAGWVSAKQGTCCPPSSL